MRFFLFLFLSVALFTGCAAPRYGDFFLYDDDGCMKPRVVFLPVVSWEEPSCENLTGLIKHYAQDSGALFSYTDEEVQAVLDLSNQSDLMNLACYFKPADFVVETIVIQDVHTAKERMVRLRLQVADIRGQTPKIILLEVVEEREILTVKENYRPIKSMIYERLAEKAANRLEEIIIWRTNCQ